MGYILEDGQGSRRKTAIMENRLRTLTSEVSLMNHISSEAGSVPTGGDPFPGVYNASVSGSFSTSSPYFVYAIQNTDPMNLLVIDRAYIQVISVSPGALPSTDKIIAAVNLSNFAPAVGTTITPVNDNQSISPNITPNVISVTNYTSSGSTDVGSIFPILGEVMELIPQESDGIILGFGKTFGIIYFSTAPNTIFINTLVRFAMVPPGNMG